MSADEAAEMDAWEQKAWDDLSTVQKIGYSLWWPLQCGLYVGGSILAGSR
jgi:hypothetical protein